MTHYMEMDSLRLGYAELGAWIMANGDEVAPRGENTREMLGFSFACHDPSDSLPVGTGRGVVKALAATETLQLIAGIHDSGMLVAAAPHFEAYLDPETGEQRSPYGLRLAEQIPTAITELRNDPDTRRAQVVIWQPELDNYPGLHDYPCTTSLQWMIRGGKLHMQVHMRSNDFWLGVPYDVFMFTQLQLTIARVLNLEPGTYRHSAASLHVYEKHWDMIEGLTAPTSDALPAYGLRGLDWRMVQERARAIHYGEPLEDPAPGEQWLQLAMAALGGG